MIEEILAKEDIRDKMPEEEADTVAAAAMEVEA